MPYGRPSPVSSFLDRFLQGLQVYQSFQDLDNRRRQTDIELERQGLLRQKFEDEQRRQQVLEDFARSYEAPTQQTIQTPAAIPEQITPDAVPGVFESRRRIGAPSPISDFIGGMAGPPSNRPSIAPSVSLSPELAMPSMEFNQEVPATEASRLKGALVRSNYSPAILKMLEQTQAMQPKVINDPNVGSYIVGENVHFPPNRPQDKTLSPAEQRYFTPESVREYFTTGDRSVLEPAGPKQTPEAAEELRSRSRRNEAQAVAARALANRRAQVEKSLNDPNLSRTNLTAMHQRAQKDLDIAKAEGNEAAVAINEDLISQIQERYKTMLGPKKLPAGIPDGSKLIGKTRAGKPVYTTPDGINLTVD